MLHACMIFKSANAVERLLEPHLFSMGEVLDQESARLLNSTRPSKYELFSCLSHLGKFKPDSTAQRVQLAQKLGIAVDKLGITGCCVVDADGRVRTVEGSGGQHVLLDLAHSNLLKHAVAFISHVPCRTCCIVAASSGLAKLVIAQNA